MANADTIPTVEVLLATYNGEHYLQQQIDSILAQTGVTVRITARDDGSTDTSTELLARRVSAGTLNLLPTGTPTGSATGNFRLLLQQSSANYVALADQDDVWQTTKLERSLQAMRALEQRYGPTTPLLVFTDLTVVDVDLDPVAPSLWHTNGLNPHNVQRLGRLLGENVVTGCTALLNYPLAALTAQMPQPSAADSLALQHDHWIALLACTLGHATWLPQPTVHYRQHPGNVLGAAPTGSRFQRLFSAQARDARAASHMRLQAQAQSFQQTYRSLLDATQHGTIDAFCLPPSASCLEQLRKMLQFDLWRSTPAKNAVALVDLLR